jgi:hypothetical protein
MLLLLLLLLLLLSLLLLLYACMLLPCVQVLSEVAGEPLGNLFANVERCASELLYIPPTVLPAVTSRGGARGHGCTVEYPAAHAIG